LEQADVLLEDVKCYSAGASAEIRIAIQQPNNPDAQRAALDILDKLVTRIRTYYELSQRIEQIVPLLLWELCSGPLPPAEQLDTLQATCRQFARLIDFVLSFDTVKMCTPALQNDFSFYRRAMSRESDVGAFAVPLELANTISLFLASPTPMLSALTSATTNFVATHIDLPVANTTDTLATVVQVCQSMVEKEENWERLSEPNRSFTMRIMVGAIILYDHVDSAGAFCKDSPIDIRSIVQLIKAQSRSEQAESLLSALHYTTKHLNDSNTPKSVRALFP
uniref:CYRIA-B_Rac1-bd domain-containing protein n=1 Tax=Gongylonema pulchrum TaxID=637853 RepID=A0A183DZS7_9BILA